MLAHTVKIFTCMAALVLGGCAFQGSDEPLANQQVEPNPSYVGVYPPKNYKKLIKQNFSHVLMNPKSATYTFMQPKSERWSVVCGTVTTESIMPDGTKGFFPFIVLFKNGKIVGRIFRESGPSEIASGEFNDPC